MWWLLFCCALLSCTQGSNEHPNKTDTGADTTDIRKKLSIKTAASFLNDGDLLTRSDDDFESLSLQNFSKRDRTYSHSGIVFREDSGYYIYHSMAGPENPDGRIKREPFDSFVNPVKKTGFGIFRYQLSPAEVNDLHILYKKYYAEKMPFDKSFNLKNDDSMYCSEIIYKSLKHVTNNRIILPTSALTNFKPKMVSLRSKNAFFKKFEYVGLDDLYMNPFCKEISRVHY